MPWGFQQPQKSIKTLSLMWAASIAKHKSSLSNTNRFVYSYIIWVSFESKWNDSFQQGLAISSRPWSLNFPPSSRDCFPLCLSGSRLWGIETLWVDIKHPILVTPHNSCALWIAGEAFQSDSRSSCIKWSTELKELSPPTHRYFLCVNIWGMHTLSFFTDLELSGKDELNRFQSSSKTPRKKNRVM